MFVVPFENSDDLILLTFPLSGLLEGPPEDGQYGEEGDAEAEEGPKDCPIEMVEEDKEGPTGHHQAPVREPDEDHAEDRAEEEGEEVGTEEDALAELDDFAAKEPVMIIL